MAQHRYISTGRDGRSRTGAGEVVFELPTTAGEVGAPPRPGRPSSTPTAVIELRTVDGLLDDLGERIFLAEPVGAEGVGTEAAGGEAAAGGEPVVRVPSARLLAETEWDDATAARFAVECATHALDDHGTVALPHGLTLARVLDDARGALDRAAAPGPALGLLARMATLHRLRRDGAAVSDLAMLAAKQDGRAGIDLFEDPAWTRLAAISEAVLAAAEALWHLVAPGYVGHQEELAAPTAAEAVAGDVHVEETPWGWVAIGAERVPTHVPAATCAQQAAERARQAVADDAGADAARAERAWQSEQLASFLGVSAADRP